MCFDKFREKLSGPTGIIPGKLSDPTGKKSGKISGCFGALYLGILSFLLRRPSGRGKISRENFWAPGVPGKKSRENFWASGMPGKNPGKTSRGSRAPTIPELMSKEVPESPHDICPRASSAGKIRENFWWFPGKCSGKASGDSRENILGKLLEWQRGNILGKPLAVPGKISRENLWGGRGEISRENFW